MLSAVASLPLLHRLPILTLILMISNRRLGRERDWDEAGTAMWRLDYVRRCSDHCAVGAEGFWRAADARVIISSKAAWQSTEPPPTGTSQRRRMRSFLVMRGKCNDATIDVFVLRCGNLNCSVRWRVEASMNQHKGVLSCILIICGRCGETE